jgi:NADH-quinone oxidoreductase subunit G
MAIIFVDGRPYEVDPGQNLLHACLSLGFDLPYFCWHPSMGSVGACRQCAVKQFRDENDRKGRIVMACMTPAADGTRISIDDPEVQVFRRSVIEWLMANHPHDCPVCDEGGECHLQDMTVMTGHTYRKYRFRKRTFRNQDLGPFLNHEMNRCIQCYRCVRFYRDYAGGRDLHALSLNHAVYFGRHADGVLENPFSGNLAEVCPTGVFTDGTHKRHYARKWDEATAPSVCERCGLGCNTHPAERYGTLRRILNRYNHDVNGFFLCDRGRFGYEVVNGDLRVRRPLVRDGRGEALRLAAREEALGRIAEMLGGGAIGIGSPRASLEANFALRALVGPDRFFLGVSESHRRLVATTLAILRDGPVRAASLRDAEESDAVLVLGEDVPETAPRLALSLRQAVRNGPMDRARRVGIPPWHDAAVRDLLQSEKGPLFVATPDGTGIDDLAARIFRAAPDDIARLGFAVAHELSTGAPPVRDLPEEARTLAREIAGALAGAANPLVVSGAGCGSEAVLRAAANVAWALGETGRRAGLLLAVPECNSLGLALLGDKGLDAARAAVREGKADTVIVLENDLYRRADAASVDALLDEVRHVVVVDALRHRTADRADVLLPGAAVPEGSGTFVSGEGRAQRFFRVFIPDFDAVREEAPPDGIRESWRWLRDIGRSAGRREVPPWESLDDIVAALAAADPALGAVPAAASPSGFRIAGQGIPRQPPRYSGRTAMFADATVHEPQAPSDPDAPLAHSMEGYPGQPPSSLVPWFWKPGWNSIQATYRYQVETGKALRGGPPGVRLIEPARREEPGYFAEIPTAFVPKPGEWLLVPLHHIFGSEELSALSPAVASRAPDPYVALGPGDAAALGVVEGEEVAVAAEGVSLRLPVAIRPHLPSGVAGLPAGLPALPWVCLPGRGRIAKEPRP